MTDDTRTETAPLTTFNRWNRSRFSRDDPRGFYESFFQRANHPSRPLAFWIRYTSFSPRGRPQDACGELWAIYFDGESDQMTAVSQAIPAADCEFSRTSLNVRIGDAILTEGTLRGRTSSRSHALGWTLEYTRPEPPLLLLPESFYEHAFPKAKALVGAPNAVYAGTLTVDAVVIPVEGWRGSQNHNWGSRHTDRYAWGQIAGFDNAPGAFLECATAQIRLGPFWSPRLTLVVLREPAEEIAINSLSQAVRATGNVRFFSWDINTQNRRATITGRIHAERHAFIGLTYRNPPGGTKICLNTKLASAEFTVRLPGRPPRTLVTGRRAAFEILTDRTDHGVPLSI